MPIIMEYIRDLRDIEKISSGMDADGAPRAAASLSSMDGGKMDTACFMDAEINIASGGGCAVIVADFKPHAYNSLQKALKLKGQQVLIVTPYALEGKVSLAYSNLVYSCCYPYGKGKRLLLAFDNTQTLPLETDDINYAEIVAVIDRELMEQEEELDRAIFEAEDSAKKAQGYLNPFNDANRMELPDMDTEEDKNHGMRAVRE